MRFGRFPQATGITLKFFRKWTKETDTMMGGGETGIRTLGTLSRSTVFKTVAFDHSATSPVGWGLGVANQTGKQKTTHSQNVPKGISCRALRDRLSMITATRYGATNQSTTGITDTGRNDVR